MNTSGYVNMSIGMTSFSIKVKKKSESATDHFLDTKWRNQASTSQLFNEAVIKYIILRGNQAE
jgi:hypothetical protein